MAERSVIAGLGLAPEGLATLLGMPGAPETAAVAGGRRQEQLLGRAGLLLLAAARAALADAGCDGDDLEAAACYAAVGAADPDLAVLARALAASRGDPDPEADLARFLAGGYRDVHPLWPLTALDNIPFCLTCTELGIGGDNSVLTPSPDATLLALAEAACAVAEGRAPVALAGAVAPAAGAMARARLRLRQGPAAGSSRTPAEGAAVLALVPADRPRRRAGAVVAGWGSAWGEGGEGLQGAARSAMARSGVAAGSLVLALVSPGDGGGAAVAALSGVLGRDPAEILSLAAAHDLGNLGPAASAVDLCLAVAAVEGGELPPPVAGRVPAVGGPVLVAATGSSGQAAAVVLTAAG